MGLEPGTPIEGGCPGCPPPVTPLEACPIRPLRPLRHRRRIHLSVVPYLRARNAVSYSCSVPHRLFRKLALATSITLSFVHLQTLLELLES